MNLKSDKDIITSYNLTIEFILYFIIMQGKRFLHIYTNEENMASLFTQKLLKRKNYISYLFILTFYI